MLDRSPDWIRLAVGLHPSELDAGLPRALARLAERCPIPTELTIRGDDRYPPDVQATIYFATAEALANVAKHAYATLARIDVQRHHNRLLWTVSDDGAGGADPGRGSGLIGIADRIAAAGGVLRTTSTAGLGTVLAADLPLGRVDVTPSSLACDPNLALRLWHRCSTLTGLAP